MVELALDGAARDRATEQWKSSFVKSIICDVKSLREIREEYGDTDEGRLLKGLGGNEEANAIAVIIYIYKRCRKVYEGIRGDISGLYEELGEHAEEVHYYLKVRGAEYKILRYMEGC